MSLGARKLCFGGSAVVLWVVLLGVLALPALAAAPETPETGKASVITDNSAVLHGELNPHAAGESGEWLFEAGINPPGPEECGNRTYPEPFGIALGHEKEVVETEATGLQPNHLYYDCLVLLTKSGAVAFSPPLTFTTLPAPPSIYPGTTKATNVSPFAATLEAKINPNNETTSYRFEYATNEGLTGAKTITGQSPLTGYGEEIASVDTGNVLTPETTYYFRLIAENEQSKKEDKPVEGPVEHFTTGTPEKPVFVSQEVTAVNSGEPKFSAKINPNYQATEYHFEYSTQVASETLEGPITTINGAPPAADLPAVFAEEGLLAGPVSVTGLQPGPTYYRVVATNASGTTDGPVSEFLALGAPTVLTGAAQAPTRTAATVAGSVDPQGLLTTYHFAYIPLAAYEAAVAQAAANPYAATGGRNTHDTKLTYLNFRGREVSYEGYAAQPVELTLEELASETTYVYALIAHNELGSVTGPPQTFTTAPAPPTPAGPAAVEAAAAPVGPAFAPAAVFPLLPYSSIAALDANEAKEGKASAGGRGLNSKSLTRSEKLAKALRACRKVRGSRRVGCERKAHKRFGPAGKKRAKK